MASRNPLTPEQRRLRSQIANAARWSRVPPSQRAAQTQAARVSTAASEESRYVRLPTFVLKNQGRSAPAAARMTAP